VTQSARGGEDRNKGAGCTQRTLCDEDGEDGLDDFDGEAKEEAET